MLRKGAVGIVYLGMIAAIVVLLFRARDQYAHNEQTRLDTPRNLQQWKTWRDKAKTQEDEEKGDGNIMRKAPKSIAPPTVVLLRDHFPMCLTGAIFFGSMLYWVSAFLLTGMLKNPTR